MTNGLRDAGYNSDWPEIQCEDGETISEQCLHCENLDCPGKPTGTHCEEEGAPDF